MRKGKDPKIPLQTTRKRKEGSLELVQCIRSLAGLTVRANIHPAHKVRKDSKTHTHTHVNTHTQVYMHTYIIYNIHYYTSIRYLCICVL